MYQKSTPKQKHNDTEKKNKIIHKVPRSQPSFKVVIIVAVGLRFRSNCSGFTSAYISLQTRAYDLGDNSQQAPHSCYKRRTPPTQAPYRSPLPQAVL